MITQYIYLPIEYQKWIYFGNLMLMLFFIVWNTSPSLKYGFDAIMGKYLYDILNVRHLTTRPNFSYIFQFPKYIL